MNKRILGAVLALCLAVCLALSSAPARADFGDFGGSSDYDFGSSYDSDWGSDSWDSDWDDDDSWDSDWDSGWDDDDSWDTGGSFVYFGDSGSSGGGMGGGMLLVVIIVIALIIVAKSRKKSGSAPAVKTAPVNAAPRIRLEPMEGYAALDPAFDRAAFTEKLSNLYVQMQNAWTDKDIESLRPYFSDALFAQMDRQLDAYRRQHRTNCVERIAVMQVHLLGYYRSGGEDHIAARLETRIVDYTVDDATGEVISGDRNTEKFMTYEWELARPSGKTTGAAGGQTTVNCPNCGAPLDVNQSARCEYCDSVITLEEHDWVLTSMRGVSQRSR